MSLLLSLRIHVLFGFFERQVERVQERYWWLMLMTHKGGEKAGLIRENLRPHCRPNTCERKGQRKQDGQGEPWSLIWYRQNLGKLNGTLQSQHCPLRGLHWTTMIRQSQSIHAVATEYHRRTWLSLTISLIGILL